MYNPNGALTNSPYWSLTLDSSERIVGTYPRTELRRAMRDACEVRAAGIACDVRKIVGEL